MAVPDDDCALCRCLRRRYGRFFGFCRMADLFDGRSCGRFGSHTDCGACRRRMACRNQGRRCVVLVQAQRSDGPREGGHRTEFEHQQYSGCLLHGEYRERGTFGDHRIRISRRRAAGARADAVFGLFDQRSLRRGACDGLGGAAGKKTDEDFIYVSHFASLNNRTVRNYSFCYDKTLHVAHWVAYPLHSVYRGSIDRTDDFQYDPKVDYPWQPNLVAGSYRAVTTGDISSLRRTVRLRGS